jgi:hypothetical protein
MGFAAGRRHGGHGLFGLDAEKMSLGRGFAAALSVLVPVALSGVFLMVFVPRTVVDLHHLLLGSVSGFRAPGERGYGAGR